MVYARKDRPVQRHGREAAGHEQKSDDADEPS